MTTLQEILLAIGTGRRQVDDPFFAEGDDVCQAWRRLGVFDIDDEELCHETFTRFPCNVPGCTLVFDSVYEFDLHYNSLHRYYCAQCKKRLPSPHLLDLHLSETHDSFFKAQAERKPMYSCYVEDCASKFANSLERRNHCIADHKFPHDFRFDDARKQNSVKKKKPPSSSGDNHPDAMETNTGTETSTNKITGAKKKYKKHGQKKNTDADENQMLTDETIDENVVKDKGAQFRPFSFGRGCRRGWRGGVNWFQRSGTAPPKASTLETSLVDDLMASLPEPVT